MQPLSNRANYNAYLVRIWRPDTLTPWRILVENIPSHERKGVRSWDELLEFLRDDVSSAGSVPRTQIGDEARH